MLTATRRGPALLALLVVVVVTALAWLVELPSGPSPAADDAARFSAGRAAPDLDTLAAAPPQAVRDQLVARLAAIGLAPQVQQGSGISGLGQTAYAGRVENVVATLPGTAPTGRVVVAAHYDAAPGSPGAADARASVAAMLEIARALQAGPRPRNDVVFLFTGGGEAGLLGASAYVRQQPEPAVVVVGDALGNAGPAQVFGTTQGAGPVLAALAADAEHPVGTSVGPALAALRPDPSARTDLAAFDAAGYAGVALGFVDGRAYDRSPLDAPAALAPASLQQLGDTMLSLVRGYGDRDVPELLQRSGGTFFAVFGLVVHYSDAWVAGLALASLFVVLVLAEVAGRRRGARGPRLIAGVVTSLLALAAAAALGAGLWQLLVTIRPGYGVLADPYRPGLYRAAVGVLAAAVVLVWWGILRRMVGALGLAFGAVFWLTVLGIVAAGLVPGAAFATTVAALSVGVAAIVALLLGDGRPRWQLGVWTAGPVPAALLLLGAGRTALQGGLAQAASAAVLFVAFGLAAMPLVAGLVGRRTRLFPLLALLVGVGLVSGGLQVDRVDDAHPQPTALTYVSDALAGTAEWVSTDAAPPEWTRRLAPQPGAVPAPLPYGGVVRWHGPAQSVALPAPEATLLGTRPTTGGTVVSLHLRSVRAADRLVLQADRPVLQVTVAAGATQPLGPGTQEDRRWPFRLEVAATDATVELTVADPKGTRFRISDATTGLDGTPGFVPRPPDLVRSSGPDSDLVVVSAAGPTLPA